MGQQTWALSGEGASSLAQRVAAQLLELVFPSRLVLVRRLAKTRSLLSLRACLACLDVLFGQQLTSGYPSDRHRP